MFVFFFKQKTAYEMRISDWSSDVCSSDLAVDQRDPLVEETDRLFDLFDLLSLAGLGAALDLGEHLLQPLLLLRQFGGGTGPACFGIGIGERGRPSSQLGTERGRSEEHTSELQSLMRISYAVFCLKKKKKKKRNSETIQLQNKHE